MRYLYISVFFLLVSCSSSPKSAIIYGNSQTTEWGDTIRYVLPKKIDFKNEQVNKKKFHGIETSNTSLVMEGESANDIRDALGNSLESLIRTAGRIPLNVSAGSAGLILIVDSFNCKNSFEYTQQLVHTTNTMNSPFGAINSGDGSSYSHKEKCDIVLSQAVDGKILTKKMYLWDGKASKSVDYVDQALSDFMNLREEK